jgi:4-hydroxybenzoate polyprenyltransferase
MFVAAKGFPSLVTIGPIPLALVFARTVAMAFNRVADWETDKLNPRTAGQHKLVPKVLNASHFRPRSSHN